MAKQKQGRRSSNKTQRELPLDQRVKAPLAGNEQEFYSPSVAIQPHSSRHEVTSSSPEIRSVPRRGRRRVESMVAPASGSASGAGTAQAYGVAVERDEAFALEPAAPPSGGTLDPLKVDDTAALGPSPVDGGARGELPSVGVSPLEGTAIGASEEPDTLEATGTVIPLQSDAVAGFDASAVISSSKWTGRRSVTEQVQIITQFAPLAQLGARQLERAIRERRFNDPETHEALTALKELHRSLGELIGAAERGEPLDPIWRAVEANKERFFTAVTHGAKVMVAAPIVAIGVAQVFAQLSGVQVSGEMLATLYGSGVIGEALVRKKK